MCLAMPGKVEKIYNAEDQLLKSADISFEGVVKRANVAYIEDVKIGDYVIVHAGVAIQILDEKSALETIQNFRDIGEHHQHELHDH